MKSLKHLTILLLAIGCSFFAGAQCPGGFTVNVTGNNIAVNAGNGYAGYQYAWYLDGNLVQAASVDTAYTYVNVTTGLHRVCMYSYNNNVHFCDSVCQSVTVTACDSITATITGNTAPVCYNTSPGTYTAIATGGTGTYTYQWYNSAGIIPGAVSSTYSPGLLTASNYYSCQVSSGNCGTAHTGDAFANLYANLTAAISGGTTPVCINSSPGTLTATAAGGTSNYTYQWYSNAGIITGATSSTYAPGNLQTSMSFYCTITSGNCGSVNTAATTITVAGNLTANWTYTVLTNDSVHFVATDTNSIAHHIFNFGDGTSTTSNTTSITHVYSAPGTYHVCFYCYIPGTSCSDSLCQNVVVPSNNTPCGTAAFETYILNDSTIRGYSTSTGTTDSSSYIWNVYNANGVLVHAYNTGHTNNFLSAGLPVGTYRVCLSLYNAQQTFCDSACSSVTILSCSSLTAAWQYVASASNDTLKLYGPSSEPTGTVYSWTFGDGTTSSLASLTHVYSQSGVYTVCLVVSNPSLTCRDTLCQSITIGNPNACGTAAFETYILNDSTIRGYSTSTGTSDSSSYIWNVYNANGVLVHAYNTGHTNNFLSAGLPVGTYRVCLSLYNAQQTFCDSACSSVTILSCSSLTAAWQYVASASNDTLKLYGPSSEPTGTVYSWTFGDGTTSSLASLTHIYSQSGVYTVCLVVSNPSLTCRDTLCQSITIGNPNACGTASFASYILNDSTIRGYSTSTGTSDSSSYVWNVYSANGALIQSSSTGHTSNFLSNSLPAGTYRVCLDLYNAQHTFCDSACNSVTVLRCSSLNAQYFYTVGTNDSVKFSPPTNNPAGSTFVWTFGDGTSSTSTAVTHVYATAGTYTACLIVSNPALTCHDTLCQSITATGSNCGSLTAYWNFTTPVNDTVRFTAYDTISSAHHIFNFGDGTYSTSGTSVTHVYTAPGTYNVCFYSYIPGSACSDSLCRTVVVPALAPTCGVAVLGAYVAGDSSIHAYSNSTGVDSTTYYGYVVRNAAGTSVFTDYGTNLTFIRTPALSPGAYSVCLYIRRANANIYCDTACISVVIPIVGACGTPSFADTVYAGIGGGAIHAYTTSTSVDSLSQYSWKIWGPNGGLVQTFTGGDFTSSTLDSGTYVVCQYIRATASTYICDSICHTVVVGGGSNPCNGLTAAWTHTLQSNTTDSVEFHSSANPAGTSYLWTFGDGTYATSANVVHGYAQSGTYTVCLITTLTGTTCRDTSCQSVVITTTTPCPVAAFAQYVYSDSMIHAYSSSTGTTANTVYAWHVTNSAGVVVQSETSIGTTASLLSHGLPNGTYDVCLFVYANANTFCDSVCHTITILDTVDPCAGLNAAFTETHLSNGNVQFTEADTAAGLTHYWHFGDGTIATGSNPVHAYATSGLFHVCQYVFYAGSTCLDSFCTNVQASASGCNANFSSQGYYPPYNGVHFTNLSTSTDSIIAYRWTFGDSTNASFASGNHVFPHSGTWYVCLSIYASNGCSSTYCDSVKVSYDPCYGLSSNYTYTYTQSGGVQFAASTNITNATNYWSFGDGTYATTFDPIHYYTQAGTYTVCHIISIPGTLCSDTTCLNIQGTGVGTGCHANFTDSTALNTNTVFLTNTSTSNDSIVGYHWSFGDGTGSYNSTQNHVYSQPGIYNLCLTINTANGCTNTYCDSVHVGTVAPDCHASFTYTIDSCQVVTFTSTSTGSLSFLRWIYGDGTTDTLSHPTHVYAQSGNYTVILHFYGTNCYNFDTVVINVPSCTTPGDTVCGFVFNDLNGNGVQNAGEPGIANAEVHVGSYVTHADSTGHYVVVVPPGTYTIYYCAPAGYTFTIPVHAPYNSNAGCSAYNTVVVTNGANCGYNFGIQVNSVTICGTVYFDANNNHSQDQNESGIANRQVIFTDSGHVVYTAYTDQYGHYCAVLGVGTYVITVGTGNYQGGVITPGSITVNATTAGGAYDNNNFGVYVAPGSCDLSVTVVPNTTVTPGYPANYMVEVCNVGANVTSGTVDLYYDPSMTYRYASPAATSQNSTTFTATWAVTNLNPGSCQNYYVSFVEDSTATTGQFIFTLASVSTIGCQDANQNNNIDTVHQNVTASWDPNNKQVSPVGKGADGEISNNQWLTYTINFQNTGTAPAVNIVVQDTLSPFLDLTTFKMLGASLPYTMQFAGNEAIWKFNSVMLPDSSSDQQASHGYVSFMILPVQGLPGKTRITNQADIFFDYNAGVSTNQTLNTIDYALSVDEISAGNVTITLQPNPFSLYTTLKIDGTEGPYELNVYDMLGRVVKAQTAAGNIFSVERGSLASGMYMYEILQQGKVIGKGKMIAQ